MSHNKKSSARGKEVATSQANGSVEESFGSAPPRVSIGGGSIRTFGFRPRSDGGVWPKADHSVDVKTGFPQGYDSPTKGPKP